MLRVLEAKIIGNVDFTYFLVNLFGQTEMFNYCFQIIWQENSDIWRANCEIRQFLTQLLEYSCAGNFELVFGGDGYVR